MARELVLGESFDRLRKRLGFRGGDRLSSIFSMVLPSYRVAKAWSPTELDEWAYTADQPLALNDNGFPAVAVFAGSRRVLIRECWMQAQADPQSTTLGLIYNLEAHYSRAVLGYNPVPNHAGEFFPTSFPGPEINIPHARVIAGDNTALPQATINGTFIAPLIGPRFRFVFQAIPGGPGVLPNYLSRLEQVVKYGDPPITVPPRGVWFVQMVNPTQPGQVFTERLTVNLRISEVVE